MKRLYVDMSRKYGAWTPICETKFPSGRLAILCRCECGKESRVSPSELVHGKIAKCLGCSIGDRSRTHGCASGDKGATPEYRVWCSMRNRCNNPNDEKNYKDYGGRGIKVCDRWNSFEHFLEDMGHRPSPRHSIERRNVNGNYEPDNCYWATAGEQARNRRDNHLITFNGETKCLTDWARELGINHQALSRRIAKGMSIEDAFQVGNYNHRMIEYQGRSQSLAAWAREAGIKVQCFGARLKSGWTMEKAMTTPVRQSIRSHSRE